jgi:hypothetical protein
MRNKRALIKWQVETNLEVVATYFAKRLRNYENIHDIRQLLSNFKPNFHFNASGCCQQCN